MAVLLKLFIMLKLMERIIMFLSVLIESIMNQTGSQVFMIRCFAKTSGR